MLTGIGTLLVAAVALFATRSWRHQQKETKLSDAATSALAKISELDSVYEELASLAAPVLQPLIDSNHNVGQNDVLLFRALCNSIVSQSDRINAKADDLIETVYFLANATGQLDLERAVLIGRLSKSRVGLARSFIELIDHHIQTSPSNYEKVIEKQIANMDLNIFRTGTGTPQEAVQNVRQTIDPKLRLLISIYS